MDFGRPAAVARPRWSTASIPAGQERLPAAEALYLGMGAFRSGETGSAVAGCIRPAPKQGGCIVGPPTLRHFDSLAALVELLLQDFRGDGPLRAVAGR